MKYQQQKYAFFSALFLFGLFLPVLVWAEPSSVNSSSPKKSSSSDLDSEKLDQVLKGQEEILKTLSDMKQELYVIKVRATKR